MNFQTLRYLVEIEHYGSINKASQALYISQSALSRALKETEDEIKITIFHRTSKGVTPTYDGQQFLERIRLVLSEIDDLEAQYFGCASKPDNTLLVATQRCTAVVKCFIEFYGKYCADMAMQNLALQETTTEEIINLVRDNVYHVGILHYTSDNEADFLHMCHALNLEIHPLHESLLCAQMRQGHPLAKEVSIGVDALASYPHVTFSDEDIPKVNYCSDVMQFNKNVLKKRIVLKSMGTLKQILKHTDGYFIGCDFTGMTIDQEPEMVYVPLNDMDITIKTIWIHRSGYVLSEIELLFVKELKKQFALLPQMKN